MATQSITLPVQGMTCAGCVNHVERSLNAVPGVGKSVVSLATGRATVQLADTNVSVERLIQAVHDAGYEVPVATTTLTITGMTCASCVGHVEGALKGLDGVLEVSVALQPGSAKVKYIPGTVTTAQMKRAVQGVGYEAAERAGSSADTLDLERQKREEEIRRQGWNLLIALTIGMVVMIGTFYDMLGPLQAVVPEWLS